MSSICRVFSWASSELAWTVCPSCHRNSGRPQKHPRPQFPPHDVSPLVDKNRQVAVRLEPACKGRPDDRLAGRPHDERFFQLRRRGRLQATFAIRFQPMMRHDGALLGKPFDMLGLFFQKAHRNEQRKISILDPGRLEHRVELALDVLPDRVAPRLDDHAAPHVGSSPPDRPP